MRGVGPASGPTPLVTVEHRALTVEAEHLELDAEQGEGLTGLYIFNLYHHTCMLQEGTDKMGRFRRVISEYGQVFQNGTKVGTKPPGAGRTGVRTV